MVFQGIQLLQLADDTALPNSSLEQLNTSFEEIIHYSTRKFMHINFDITHYLHMSKFNPITEDIVIHDNIVITPAPNNQCVYFGMLFTNTNDIKDLMRANLKYKAFNIAKCYDWLDVNENTSISIKLRVLDNCMYSSLLYGCEVWWKVDDIKEELLKEERKKVF